MVKRTNGSYIFKYWLYMDQTLLSIVFANKKNKVSKPNIGVVGKPYFRSKSSLFRTLVKLNTKEMFTFL